MLYLQHPCTASVQPQYVWLQLQQHQPLQQLTQVLTLQEGHAPAAATEHRLDQLPIGPHTQLPQ